MTQFLDTQLRVNRDALNYRGAVETIMWVPPLRASLVLPEGKVGELYVAAILVSGGKAPYHFSAEFLPKNTGLTFDRETGVLSGTPTHAFHAEGLMFVVSDGLGKEAVVLNNKSITIKD